MMTESTMTQRYFGFTCPKCGAHEFGTFMWHPTMGDRYPAGHNVGACHGSQYNRLNVCKYKWDREDKVAEAEAIYHPSRAEYEAAYESSPFYHPEDTAVIKTEGV